MKIALYVLLLGLMSCASTEGQEARRILNQLQDLGYIIVLDGQKPVEVQFESQGRSFVCVSPKDGSTKFFTVNKWMFPKNQFSLRITCRQLEPTYENGFI